MLNLYENYTLFIPKINRLQINILWIKLEITNFLLIFLIILTPCQQLWIVDTVRYSSVKTFVVGISDGQLVILLYDFISGKNI